MYSSQICLPPLSILLKIVLTVTTLVVFSIPPSTLGNPITKRQFQKVVKLLEESIAKEIPSDDADQYSDLLYQEKHEKKNLTFYHAGDKKFPVYISNGLGSLNSPIHVLLRGEDYINPKDKNNFVVLRKMASGEYAVHQAHILNMNKFKKGSKVIWNAVRVEQQKNIKPLLEQMGNSEVQARSLRSQRPLCDWIGYSLFCQTTKNIPPVRERKEQEPLDEEDDQPVKLPGIVEENPEGAAKSKRYIGSGSSRGTKKENIVTGGNALLEEVVSDEEEKRVLPNIPTTKPTKTLPIKTTTTPTTTTQRTTTVAKTAPTAPGRKVIIKEVEKEGVPEKKATEEEEQVSKKKHTKRKHKSKRKHVDANKED